MTRTTPFSQLSTQQLKKEAVKDLIILLLAEQWPLTARKIYYLVKKSKTITYQAVHKTLQHLLREEIVARDDKNKKEYIQKKYKQQ